ncbi:hypothetical protein C7212DRAFT_341025 [Tuber magnatum]|uniref:Fungal N-terminal domain-containing protein n=1 Tax=Tuber magnatum TaxID=42249 RepID=A0A317T2C6_9PEZI|nr:hypothetical protein C7212DRAFT_341025 [Tuber magnatum]
MESAFGIVEVLSVTDISLRTGQKLCERYNDIRGAHRDLNDLNARVEHVWTHIAYQLRTIKNSSDAVPDTLRGRMVDLLHQLQFILHTACKNLTKTADIGGWTMVEAIRFTLFLKRALQKDVGALEKWRVVFDSAFFTPFCEAPNLIKSFQKERFVYC